MLAAMNDLISEIRGIAQKAVKPLFFFDDDPDGCCSFLLLYRMTKNGKGIILKQKELTPEFVRNVEEYLPDVIFILDVPRVSKEFLDAAGKKSKIVWIDHHPIESEHYSGNALYLNPKTHGIDDNYPTSYFAYKIAQQDIWIGAVGVVSDWAIPDFFDDFAEQFPDLVPKKYSDVEDYRFKGPLGLLIRIVIFNLKGGSREAMKSVKILTRISDPCEIIEHSTPQANFLFKKYEYYDKEFESLISAVKVTRGRFIVFTYSDDKTSFSSELSNYFHQKYPKKIILIGRNRHGEFRCSLRSNKYNVRAILLRVIAGFPEAGIIGGGHDHACGFNIKIEFFKEFLKRFEAEAKKE